MKPTTELLESIAFAKGLIDVVADYLGVDHGLLVELQRLNAGRCWVNVRHRATPKRHSLTMIDERAPLVDLNKMFKSLFKHALLLDGRGDRAAWDAQGQLLIPGVFGGLCESFRAMLECSDPGGPHSLAV